MKAPKNGDSGWWRIALIIVASGAVGSSVFFCGSEKILTGSLAFSSVFSGLLALTGFMLTARTFITFKLNEAIYGKIEYRTRIEEFKAAGIYEKELYEPLRSLDKTIGQTSLGCFYILFVLAIYALLPRAWGEGESAYAHIASNKETSVTFIAYETATWVAYTGIIAAITEVFHAVLRVNRNIHAIIQEWEDDYKRPKLKS